MGRRAEDRPAGAAVPAGHRRRAWGPRCATRQRCSAAARSRSSTPRSEPKLPPNYRGVHRLNRDEQGRVKCVACYMCSTACPAHCIDIVAAPSPWPDREKYPETFVIDELRCIYCGMCEQACPVDAIELTTLYDLTGLSREEMMFDKEKLLSVFDQTVEGGHRPGPHARAAGSASASELRRHGLTDPRRRRADARPSPLRRVARRSLTAMASRDDHRHACRDCRRLRRRWLTIWPAAAASPAAAAIYLLLPRPRPLSAVCGRLARRCWPCVAGRRADLAHRRRHGRRRSCSTPSRPSPSSPAACWSRSTIRPAPPCRSPWSSSAPAACSCCWRRRS